jgi:hypothetical protein
MRKIWFYLLIFLVIFSCKKENDGTSNGSSITSISGKIENWTLGSEKFLLAGFYDSKSNMLENLITIDTSSIDNNGNFNLTSLAIPSDIYLISLDSFTFGSGDYKTNFNFSNHVTKILTHDLSFYIFSKDSNLPIDYIYKSYNADSDATSARNFFIRYFYVDRQVSITGSNSQYYSNFIYTTNVNLSLKAGWNKIVYKDVMRSQTSFTEDVSVKEPAGAIWKLSDAK